MHSSRLLLAAAAALAVMSFTSAPAGAQSQTSSVQPKSWISSWTASPQLPRGVLPASFTNRTIRQIVHLSLGGDKVRIWLSNEFGTRPVLIGAASVAVAGQGSGIAAQSLRPLTFGGARSFVLPPGAPLVSDAVDLDVAAFTDLAVSLYLPATTELGTVHATGLQTAYVSSAGDFTMASEFPTEDRFVNRFFLSGAWSSRWRRHARSSPSAIRSRMGPPRRSMPTAAGRMCWPAG